MVAILDTLENKVYFDVSDTVANVITSTSGWRNMTNSLVTPPGAKGFTLTTFTCDVGQVNFIDVVKGRYRVIPNTEASKVLYGK